MIRITTWCDIIGCERRSRYDAYDYNAEHITYKSPQGWLRVERRDPIEQTVVWDDLCQVHAQRWLQRHAPDAVEA